MTEIRIEATNSKTKQKAVVYADVSIVGRLQAPGKSIPKVEPRLSKVLEKVAGEAVLNILDVTIKDFFADSLVNIKKSRKAKKKK